MPCSNFALPFEVRQMRHEFFLQIVISVGVGNKYLAQLVSMGAVGAGEGEGEETSGLG